MKSNAEKLRMNITSLRIIDKTLGFQHTKRISETIFSYRCKLLKAAVGEHSGFEITAQALRILSLCFSNNHLLRAVVKHALPNSHLHATIRSLRRPLEPGFLSHRNPGVLARTRQVDCPLAIFVPYVGARSETFIRRHVEDLLPGRTAVVGRLLPQSDGDWTVDGPFLDRNSIRPMLVSPSILGLRQKGGYTSEMCENRTIKRFLRDFGVRVILGEYLHSSVRWLEVARDLNVTFFGHAHGYDVSARLQDPNWRAEYLRYNDAGGVITISDISRSKLLEIGLLPSKVHVIPYGVDVPGEAPSRPERPTIRCIAVGRMVGKKAPILTLDAFRRASDAFPQLKLDYIGDGELLPAARQFIQAFDLQDKVSLHGSQPNHVVRKMMAKADIFLQHSLTDPDTKDEEGLPLAILEAMACALPVVSTRHAGIPEAVVHGATGYLVNEGDSEAMGEQLKTLVHEPERARQMGQAGWARAKERFSWERQRKSLLALLELDAIG
jgi:glycosyltransferase involved in cell wall biosynthesis